MSALQKKLKHFMDSLQERHPTVYFLGDLLLNIVVIIGLVFGVRTYIMSPFQVYGPSMCETLNSIHGQCQDGFGEYIIVNKAIYFPFFGNSWREPTRGDIVVFRPPHSTNGEYYIKRVIGLPGEKVTIKNGRVILTNKEHQSGWELPEPYLNAANKDQTFLYPPYATQTFEVPENTFFVMGDNRKKSTDSRTCFKGPQDRECKDTANHFLNRSLVEGQAAVVLWPFNKIRILETAEYK